MTDHHTEAERLLQESGDIPASDEANYIAMAQVHATLALADAVRDQNEPSFDDLIAANREGTQEDYDRTTRHDAEIERLREEVAMTERYRDDVIQACAAAERERDDAMQAHAEDIAAKGAEIERLTREHAKDHWSDMLTNQECAQGIHADWWVDSEHNHQCPWCTIADLKARAVVLPENLTDHFEAALFGSIPGDGTRRLEANYLARLVRSWRPEPASREPEAPCTCGTSTESEPCAPHQGGEQ